MAARKSRMRAETTGERLTVYLEPSTAKALRIHCAGERLSLSAFVSEAVKQALKGARKKG
jgi:hypothetical protein